MKTKTKTKTKYKNKNRSIFHENRKPGFEPKLGLILGSGMQDVAQSIVDVGFKLFIHAQYSKTLIRQILLQPVKNKKKKIKQKNELHSCIYSQSKYLSASLDFRMSDLLVAMLVK